jgi:hypothetical protein
MMLPCLDWIQELSDSLNCRYHENIYVAEAVPVAVTENKYEFKFGQT